MYLHICNKIFLFSLCLSPSTWYQSLGKTLGSRHITHPPALTWTRTPAAVDSPCQGFRRPQPAQARPPAPPAHPLIFSTSAGGPNRAFQALHRPRQASPAHVQLPMRPAVLFSPSRAVVCRFRPCFRPSSASHLCCVWICHITHGEQSRWSLVCCFFHLYSEYDF